MFKHSYKKPIYYIEPNSLYDFYCIDPYNYEEQFRVNNPYSFYNFYRMEPNDYENQLGVNNPNPNNYHYANRGFEPYKHNLWNLAKPSNYGFHYQNPLGYNRREQYSAEWGSHGGGNFSLPSKESGPMSGPSDNTQSGKRYNIRGKKSRKSHKYRAVLPPSYYFSPYNYAAG